MNIWKILILMIIVLFASCRESDIIKSEKNAKAFIIAALNNDTLGSQSLVALDSHLRHDWPEKQNLAKSIEWLRENTMTNRTGPYIFNILFARDRKLNIGINELSLNIADFIFEVSDGERKDTIWILSAFRVAKVVNFGIYRNKKVIIDEIRPSCFSDTTDRRRAMWPIPDL